MRINVLLVAKAWILHTAIRTTEYAVSSPLLESALSPAWTAAGELTAVFQSPPWLTTGLALSGVLALVLGAFRRRRSRAYQVLLMSFGVVILNVLVVHQGEALVRGGLTLPPSITRVGMHSLASTVEILSSHNKRPEGIGQAEWLVRISGENLWQKHIIDPWVQLEFGSKQTAERFTQNGIPGGRFLSQPSSGRLELYYQSSPEQRKNWFQYWGDEYLVQRTVTAGGSFLLTSLTAVPLFLISSGILLYQALLLVSMILAPLFLVMALWFPLGAEWMLRRLWSRVLGAVLMPLILGFALAVMFLLVNVTTTVGQDLGWTFTGLSHGVIAFATWRYRKGWLQWLKWPSSSPSAPPELVPGRFVATVYADERSYRLPEPTPITDSRLSPLPAISSRSPSPVPPLSLGLSPGEEKGTSNQPSAYEGSQLSSFYANTRRIRLDLHHNPEVPLQAPEQSTASGLDHPRLSQSPWPKRSEIPHQIPTPK